MNGVTNLKSDSSEYLNLLERIDKIPLHWIQLEF